MLTESTLILTIESQLLHRMDYAVKYLKRKFKISKNKSGSECKKIFFLNDSDCKLIVRVAL